MAGERVITLGGDHSIALGTISAVLMQPQKNRRAGGLTHMAIFNTPETNSFGQCAWDGCQFAGMGMSPEGADDW